MKKQLKLMVANVASDLAGISNLLDAAPAVPDMTQARIAAELGQVQLRLRRILELNYGPEAATSPR